MLLAEPDGFIVPGRVLELGEDIFVCERLAVGIDVGVPARNVSIWSQSGAEQEYPVSEPLVIVGNGMAAARLVDELTRCALGRHAIA
jgi:hypothetical protein